MTDKPEQLALSLPKGPLNRVSFSIEYQRSVGWSVRAWHRHDGELAMCPFISRYDGLTLGEAIDVTCSTLEAATELYEVSEGRCHPFWG